MCFIRLCGSFFSWGGGPHVCTAFHSSVLFRAMFFLSAVGVAQVWRGSVRIDWLLSNLFGLKNCCNKRLYRVGFRKKMWYGISMRLVVYKTLPGSYLHDGAWSLYFFANLLLCSSLFADADYSIGLRWRGRKLGCAWIHHLNCFHKLKDKVFRRL